MAARKNPATVGIDVRHRAGCPAHAGGRCRCSPRYRGKVWDPVRKRPKRGPWMGSLAAARAWRVDGQRAVESRALTGQTVEEALRAMLAAAEAGHLRNRSGDVFKPSVIASYRNVIEGRLIPRLGSLPLSALTLPALNRFAAEMIAEGLSPSTVRNVLMPLRVVFREALAVGDVAANPTTALRLPASRGRRERIASPEEAELLLEALEVRDRLIYATALYAGLRRGELMALRFADVDRDARRLRVHPERGSYDPRSRTFGSPKSRAAVRAVPIIDRLLPYLPPDGPADALVFGRDAETPFAYNGLLDRAHRAWHGAGCRPIGLHEARHTFASYLIAAGANAKAVTVVMGHSSIATTFDRYGHLFPGHEDEVRLLLNGYLGASALDKA